MRSIFHAEPAVLYGLLTAGVAAVYLGVVELAYLLFGVHGTDLPVQVIATALGAAALFRCATGCSAGWTGCSTATGGCPTRPWPARPPRRGGRRPETALSSVVKTIADSLRLPYAALELRLGDGWSPAAAYGEVPPRCRVPADLPAGDRRAAPGGHAVARRAAGPRRRAAAGRPGPASGPGGPRGGATAGAGRVPGGPGHHAGRGAGRRLRRDPA